MAMAIMNGSIIDGRGGDPRTGMTLLIEGERIAAIGPRDQVRIPRDAIVIDAMGGSILPGLIDCHVHFLLEYPDVLRSLITQPSLRLLQAIPRMRLTLEAGVTTIRDAGGSPAGLKIAVERGIVAGPRMQVAVSMITQTGGLGEGFYPFCGGFGLFCLLFFYVPACVSHGACQISKTTREILRAGGDWIKLATTGGGISTSDAPSSPQFTVGENSTAGYEGARQGKRRHGPAAGCEGIQNDPV